MTTISLMSRRQVSPCPFLYSHNPRFPPLRLTYLALGCYTARTREARSPAKSPAKSPTNHNGEPTSPKAALSNRSPPKVADKAINNKPQDDDDDPL